jgi:hypothetical protein
MTSPPPERHAAADDGPSPAHDGALLRLPVSGPTWAERIPPVPHGRDVTVSFTTAAAAAEHAEPLALLGYRHVGTVEVAGVLAADPPAAVVLVPAALATAHPAWWRALRREASQAYPLAFGPVRAALRGVLALHTETAAR